MKKPDYSRILNISDQHAPYNHPDMIKFLTAIKKKYKPTFIVNGGDEIDAHSMSFHEHDSDLPAAGDELKAATKVLKQLEKLFPEMTILDSNHGSLAARRLKFSGVPMKYLATPQQIYGVSDKWKWVNDLSIVLPNGLPVYFCHGMTKNGIKLAALRGTCTVQFHYHTEFKIEYIGNPEALIWSLQSGCLIDRKAMAFAYDKLNLNRPIIGVSMIIDSKPLLLPMVLDRQGKWVGKL